MAWDPTSRHWCVERQTGSGSFAIWPLDSSRPVEDQVRDCVKSGLTWAEACTLSRQWEALRDFAGPRLIQGLSADELSRAYDNGVVRGFIKLL